MDGRSKGYLFYNKLMYWVRIRGPFLESPEKFYFSVYRVYIQDRDINIFEIQTIKVSGNETEWTGFEQLPRYCSLDLDLCFHYKV